MTISDLALTNQTKLACIDACSGAWMMGWSLANDKCGSS